MDATPLSTNALSTRHAIIRQLLEKKPLIGGAWPASPSVFMKDDQCLYAIPLPILNSVSSSTDNPRLLPPGELQWERAFATHCSDQKILGYSANGPIVFPLLLPVERKPKNLQANRWEQLIAWTRKRLAPNLHIDVQASLDALRIGQTTLSAFRHQQLAFQGWLRTSTQFQQEKDAVRKQWIKEGSNPALLAGRNLLKQPHHLPAEAIYSWRLQSDIGDTFLSFYRRWELDGFATWDLPIQQPANIGGTGDLGQLMDLNQTPAIQLPPSMRLPTTTQAQHHLGNAAQDHMQQWHDIQKCQRTKRYAQGFVIHYYQETVLRGILGDRLHRRQQLLDELIADLCKEHAPIDLMEGINSETIKDIRLNYRSLLITPKGS